MRSALIIANTEYTDPGLAQLTAPGKDAEDFARVLKDPDICAFDDVKVLLNQLSSSVIEIIDEFFDQKKPDDLLVLYFSGHGVRDELGSLYLAVKNTIRNRLRSTAIKSDYVREAMDQSRSRRQVLILDCCNSGAYAQGTKAATGVSIGTASAFEAGYGRIILTASDSTQFAWEGDKVIGETDNSLFTHFLVKGLEGEADLDGDGSMTVDELYDYAYEKVKLATPKQTPSKFSSKQQGEIVLRQITRIEDIKPVSLSEQLLSEIENPYPEVRLRAVQQLAKLLNGKNLGLARSAKEALERLEREDDSRRVSQAATQALESTRRTQQLALQKIEEERLATEKAEAEQKAKEEAEQLLVQQQADEEQRAKEEAQRLATLKAEEERIAKKRAEEERIARAKVEREAAEKAAREKVEREALDRARRERAERNLAQRREKLNQLRVYGQAKLDTLVNYLQSMVKTRSRLYTMFGLVIPLGAVIAFFFYQQFNNNTLFFSGSSGGETNVYSYNDNTITKVTLSIEDARNWEPAVGLFGQLYFTSNRTGKAEIYRIQNDGQAQQITNTPGSAASWAPAIGSFGQLYFTSNRTGKAEIYRIQNDGQAQQITNTPGLGASWSPAIGPFGQLYFTSDRTGKAEIYCIKDDGKVQQITNTPGSAASWAPIIRGKNMYFTSNRDGRNYVYLLNDTQAVKISSSESWTATLAERYPSSNP